MKLKSLIKKVVLCGASLTFFNYFTLPVSSFIYSKAIKKHVRDKRIQQVCKVDSHLEDIVANIDVKNCGALTLVKIAHALTTKYLIFELPPFSHQIFSSKEKKMALEKGKADCSYYSAFTYGNFLYLADKFGRPELKDKVRLCNGYVYIGNTSGLHVWLQVNLDNKWTNYETTLDPLKKEDKINFEYINMKFHNWKFLSDDGYYPFGYIQLENGKLTNHTKLFGSFEYDVDLIRFIGDRFKEN